MANRRFTVILFLLLALFWVTAMSCGDDDHDNSDNGHLVGDDDDSDDDSDDDDSGDDDDDDSGDDDDDDAVPSYGLTFFVLSDTHCGKLPDPTHFASAKAIDLLARTGQWPAVLHGRETGFLPGPVGAPAGVVFTGDITGTGSLFPLFNGLLTFRRFYQQGFGANAIDFPAYVGYGNHDLGQGGENAEEYRAGMWDYIDQRYSGDSAPVPVTSYHTESRNYSWDWDGVHLIQTHKCATDQTNGQTSALAWLADDLATYAADGRPVVLFQHYGFDSFGMEDHWWTDQDRVDLLNTISGYNVVSIVHGHTHDADVYTYDGYQIIRVNNIKDSDGSFAVVRITDGRLEMMTCEWTDDEGNFEFISPYLVLDISTL